MNFKDVCNFSGYLEKHSPRIFVGWQKRLFKILDGKVLAYFKNEAKPPKGAVDIDKIKDIKSVNKTEQIYLFIF